VSLPQYSGSSDCGDHCHVSHAPSTVQRLLTLTAGNVSDAGSERRVNQQTLDWISSLDPNNTINRVPTGDVIAELSAAHASGNVAAKMPDADAEAATGARSLTNTPSTYMQEESLLCISAVMVIPAVDSEVIRTRHRLSGAVA